MQTHQWQRWGLIATLIWVIAGGNAGMFLAVAPATSAYRTCLKSLGADSVDCQRNLQSDWTKYSGYRLAYAALVGLAPIPIVWLFALGLSAALPHRQRGRRPNESNSVDGPGYLLRGGTAL